MIVRRIWKVLESYGCLQHFKNPGMQERRNELFSELRKIYTANRQPTEGTRCCKKVIKDAERMGDPGESRTAR